MWSCHGKVLSSRRKVATWWILMIWKTSWTDPRTGFLSFKDHISSWYLKQTVSWVLSTCLSEKMILLLWSTIHDSLKAFSRVASHSQHLPGIPDLSSQNPSPLNPSKPVSLTQWFWLPQGIYGLNFDGAWVLLSIKGIFSCHQRKKKNRVWHVKSGKFCDLKSKAKHLRRAHPVFITIPHSSELERTIMAEWISSRATGSEAFIPISSNKWNLGLQTLPCQKD